MSGSLISNVIEAIAGSKGIEPGDLEIVLAEYIDPDAVEQLAKNSNSTWRLDFELPGRTVTVKSTGEILVDGRLERNWTSV